MSQTEAQLLKGFNAIAASNNAITIDGSGQVGIGTSSPASDLHIEDASATCSLSIVAGDNTSNSNIQFGDQADINVGLISYNHTDNALSARTGGSGTDVLLDSSGRLLVGQLLLGPIGTTAVLSQRLLLKVQAMTTIMLFALLQTQVQLTVTQEAQP